MRARLVVLLLLAAFTPACGDEDKNPQTNNNNNNNNNNEQECSTDPQTHLEIINACTDAEKIDKNDDGLPLLGSDGSLPPLP